MRAPHDGKVVIDGTRGCSATHWQQDCDCLATLAAVCCLCGHDSRGLRHGRGGDCWCNSRLGCAWFGADSLQFRCRKWGLCSSTGTRPPSHGWLSWLHPWLRAASTWSDAAKLPTGCGAR